MISPSGFSSVTESGHEISLRLMFEGLHLDSPKSTLLFELKIIYMRVFITDPKIHYHIMSTDASWWSKPRFSQKCQLESFSLKLEIGSIKNVAMSIKICQHWSFMVLTLILIAYLRNSIATIKLLWVIIGGPYVIFSIKQIEISMYQEIGRVSELEK